MASKRSKNAAAATDDLDELFEGLDTSSAAPTKKSSSSSKHKSSSAVAAAAAAAGEKDILAELENQLEETAQPSRPHTPRVHGSHASRNAANTTPEVGVAAATRKSLESAKSEQEKKVSFDEKRAAATSIPTVPEVSTSAAAAAPPPPAAPAAVAAPSAGGGWWGGIISTASAAMKQAEAAVKEIQQNEEAKKWAEQVKGNVSVLRGYGDELRHRAIPTFTNILQTIAPPISSHERLLIHITHDMVGYPSLDPLVHEVFSRVMAQVEGGDLMVIQRGQENVAAGSRSSSSVRGGGGGGGLGAGSVAGWHDGPWWRAVDSPRDLGTVAGLREGAKLCRASAEAYANEYYAAHGGLELARQQAVEPMSETNPVRRSDLFLAVQALSTSQDAFGVATKKKPVEGGEGKEEEGEEEDDDDDDDEEMVSFAVYVLDSVHEIVYSTVSQEMPAKWMRWLDAPALLTPATSSGAEEGPENLGGHSSHSDYDRIPEDIRDVVESGGVDPREWVAEWVEETLSLAVGVVAQRYVARRMGVGAGSIGKGKRRMDAVLEDGGGEAARAGLI